MNLQQRTFRSVTSLFAALVSVSLLFGVWSCNYPDAPAASNSLPSTRLANIPANDTIARYINLGVIPEVTLYWLGDDPDGYVVAYRYRWVDFYRGQRVEQPYQTVLNLVSIGSTNLSRVMTVKGTPRSIPDIYKFFATLTNTDAALINSISDSLETGRSFAVPYKTGVVPGDSVSGADSLVHRSPTSGTFIFESPADSNMHRFEVASIDNDGGIDPNPATVNFWTLRSPAPIVTVTAPVVNSPISSGLVDTNQIAIRHATDRFLGIRIDFSAIDFSTDDRVFSWAVDDTVNPASWSPWNESTTAFVTASSFKPIVSGWHNFYVRARNRWGVLSNIATYRHSSGQGSFKATVVAIDDPNHPKRILIINNTQSGNGTIGNPDSNQIKAFYSEVMDSVGMTGKFDIASSSNQTGIQWLRQTEALLRLGNYSTVMFLFEKKHLGFPGVFQLETSGRRNLEKYLQAGGNLIFVGPVDTLATNGALINGWGTFADTTLHAVNFVRSNTRNCIGSDGLIGYPNLRFDPAKIQPDSLGAIRFILRCQPRGFGETIGRFVATAPDAEWSGRPVSVRYLAPEPEPPRRRTYTIVRFGIPLYFCEKSGVIQSMRKALTDVHELP
jgi:hypothetical protein